MGLGGGVAKFFAAILISGACAMGMPSDPSFADLMDRPERLSRVANDQAAVETLIRARARITRSA